jgi:hypothetical protein
MIEVLREGLEELEKRPEKPAVTAAREKLKVADDKLRDTENEIEQLPATIKEKEKRRDADLLIIRNLKTGNVEDPAREARGWCPNTIQTAIAIQPATQRCKHVAEIGLRERIAKPVGKCEQAAAGFKEVQDGLHVLLREKRAWFASPTFPACIVAARGRGQHQQLRFR